MSNRNVNRLIDKTRFKTYKKVKKPVQERFQQLTDKQLKNNCGQQNTRQNYNKQTQKNIST